VYGSELTMVSKRLPGLRRPTRGDVIDFEWPKDRSKNFVNRLVGLPGDTLAMRVVRGCSGSVNDRCRGGVK
jgi:signal peptidase I